MREFLQKFVDWIAMLLRWLYAAPNDAVQCQHDTRVEKLRDVSVRHVGRGLNSSELVKGRMLLAECKSFIRQRLKRVAVGVVLLGTALSVSGQQTAMDGLNLDFSNGLSGWNLYYGAVKFSNQHTSGNSLSCGNDRAYGSEYVWDWSVLSAEGYEDVSSTTANDSKKFSEFFSGNEGITIENNDYQYVIDAEATIKSKGTGNGVNGVYYKLPNDQNRFQVITTSDPGDNNYSDPYVGKYDNSNGSVSDINAGGQIKYPRVYPKASKSCRIGAAGYRHSGCNAVSTEFAFKDLWKIGNNDQAEKKFKSLASAERMTYTFIKRKDQDVLYIHFFAVAESPDNSHIGHGAPQFDIRVYKASSTANITGNPEKDEAWISVPCGDLGINTYSMTYNNGKTWCEYRNTISSTVPYLSTGYETRNTDKKGWRTLTFPLSDIEDGDQIMLTFTTNDCNYNKNLPGGHACWMYFTSEVKTVDMSVKYCDVNGPITLTATEGFDQYMFCYKTATNDYKPLHNGLLSNNELVISSGNSYFDTYIRGKKGEIVCFMGSNLNTDPSKNLGGCAVSVTKGFGATALSFGLNPVFSCSEGASENVNGLTFDKISAKYTSNDYNNDPIDNVEFFVKKATEGDNKYVSKGSFDSFNFTYDEDNEEIKFKSNQVLLSSTEFVESYDVKIIVKAKSGCEFDFVKRFDPYPSFAHSFGISGVCQYGEVRIANSTNPTAQMYYEYNPKGSDKNAIYRNSGTLVNIEKIEYYVSDDGNPAENVKTISGSNFLSSGDVLASKVNGTYIKAYTIITDNRGCKYRSTDADINLTSAPDVSLFVTPGSYKNIDVDNANLNLSIEVCPDAETQITAVSKDNVGLYYQWFKVEGSTNTNIDENMVLSSTREVGGMSFKSAGEEKSLGKGHYQLKAYSSSQPDACVTTWNVYIQESAGRITLGDIAKVCPGDPLTIDVEGAKAVLAVNFVVEETQGATPVKTVADFSWKTSSNQLVISKVADVSLYASAYQYYYEVEFTNDDNCSEKKTFIPKNLAAPLVTYTIKNGSTEIGKTSSIDPTDNVTLWTAEPVCPGTVLTITLTNASADMTNYYVIKDAEGNSYGPTTSGRYGRSDPFSFQYTVPAVAAGGEVIRFTVKTDGMNGNVAQCAITEKLAIQVKPTVQFDMAASATQIANVTSASLASNDKNTYCVGENFYFYVRPYNENGELANASVKVQNTALLSQASTDKETIFGEGVLGYGMSGAQSDALGQYQTLKVSVSDNGCTADGEYK
ncbi:MAG: hypothetical protein K6E14_10815, partial [Paludibacteraceae bacterium]|nr:hypothetical protein [Paludibacteraceae bacterium]